jgi:hypothetical protein
MLIEKSIKERRLVKKKKNKKRIKRKENRQSSKPSEMRGKGGQIGKQTGNRRHVHYCARYLQELQ